MDTETLLLKVTGQTVEVPTSERAMAKLLNEDDELVSERPDEAEPMLKFVWVSANQILGREGAEYRYPEGANHLLQWHMDEIGVFVYVAGPMDEDGKQLVETLDQVAADVALLGSS